MLTAALSTAGAQGFTPEASLQRLFTLEGNSPYPSPYAGTLNFSALESKYASPNGHGYRNELKVADRERLSLADTREHFAARITATLPNVAKTIVAQYHVEGLDTILKVYVQDTADKQGLDGKSGNGVFDILVRILGADGKEATTALGTVRSGEGFDLDIVLNAGAAQVSARTATGGTLKTALTPIRPDTRKIYFKFGDYLQARDPVTGEHTSSPEKWDEYYRQNHIDSSHIRFSNTIFERDGAQP
ncbi:polysaccharide lyase family 7 protein [Duganella sp. CF517]|uniref:polysaccharide lyase family 7 protein n=1 Tax=Duganella sp. CF517 TaxID=1881038 RepID=UPI0015A629C0|nr:polysaccharide lyase family 7 protein [Duganella sp. CF517]